ncbi:MAG: hypothetical protein Q9213_005260 [Squamulea squamosa]
MELDDADMFSAASNSEPRYEYRFTERGIPQRVLLSGKEYVPEMPSPPPPESPVNRLSWQLADFSKNELPTSGGLVGEIKSPAEIDSPPWGALDREYEDVGDSYQIDFRAPSPPGPERSIPAGLGVEPLQLDLEHARFTDWMSDFVGVDREKIAEQRRQLDAALQQKSNANGQPTTHARTRGGKSKRNDRGASEASGAHSGKRNAREGNSTRRANHGSGGGDQERSRDHDDRDNDDRDNDDRNNDKGKKRDVPSDSSNDSSDDAGKHQKGLKSKKKTRNQIGDPKTLSPKGRKRGGRSFKQTSKTPPANCRTPSAPAGSPLTSPDDVNSSNAPAAWRENRRPPRDYGTPLNFDQTPPQGTNHDQENPSRPRPRQQRSRSPPNDRRPLGSRQVPQPHGHPTTPQMLSSFSPEAPDSPIFSGRELRQRSPPNPDVVDMGAAPRGSGIGDMRRDSIDGAHHQATGSPIPRRHPGTRIPNKIHEPQQPFRNCTSRFDPTQRPGGQFGIHESSSSSRQGSNASSGLSELSRTPSWPNDVQVREQPARVRGGRRGRGMRKERDARGRFVRAGEGVIRAARVQKKTKGTGTRGGRGNGRRGRGGSSANGAGRQTRSGTALAKPTRWSARLKGKK